MRGGFTKEVIRNAFAMGVTGIVILFLSLLAMCGGALGVWG